MKILVIADLHSCPFGDLRAALSHLSTFDLILMAGDISEAYFPHIHELSRGVPLLAVLGNHDYPGVLSRHSYITNIHGKTVKAGTITVAGIEGSNKYKEVNFPSLTQPESMVVAYGLKNADILLSHTSPFGIHEKNCDTHCGLLGINEYLEREEPRFHIHGHQHENIQTQYGETLICGVYGISLIDFSTKNISIIL